MNMVNNTDSDAALFPHHLRKQLEARMEQLAREDICLAFSGGVDSSLLLKAAADAAAHTGSRVYAVTFDSRLHPSCDLEIARRVAGELGGIHEVITVDELEQEAIKNNPVNRCYLCKRHLFLKLTELAETRGIRHILDGTNEDDMHVYRPGFRDGIHAYRPHWCRPGIRALKELGILSPLAELHITKAQVKAMASEYGISVASRPSTPCMATRLPYGALLDYEVLERIGEGESYVRTIIPGNVRLRLHGDIVRLELDTEAFGVFMERREEIVSRLKEMGFVYITLDAEGFRSGSMDTGVNEGRMKD